MCRFRYEYKEINPIPTLWPSYYHLPPWMKDWFSYYAMVPQNFGVLGKELVALWMAEKFLVPSQRKRRIEDVGDGYLRWLLLRPLYEPMDKLDVKMYDLMQNLTQERKSCRRRWYAFSGLSWVVKAQMHNLFHCCQRWCPVRLENPSEILVGPLNILSFTSPG